uniref:Uncharacterized protein n=1 Tax=Lutzomyia longipalpis TaxID=7200 RepID=A0A1B0CCM7_LUTLO
MLLSVVRRQLWRSFWRGKSFHEFYGDPTNRPWMKPLPVEEWLEQQLDPFDPTNNSTWKQRYFTNSDYFRPKDGPVFLMIGGEGTASPKWMVEGAWIKYAKEFGALCFQVEHRFYGKSHPTPSVTVDDLVYLSSETALADLTFFIMEMRRKYHLTTANRWIAFGGSYPGSLAAWLREKYPHLVHGAVSSSGPLVAIVDFWQYYNVVTEAISDCQDTVRDSIEQVELQLRTDLGRMAGPALYRLALLNKIILDDEGSPCLDFKYEKMINDLRETSWDAGEVKNGTRQWIYQTCMEFGFYQTSNSPTLVFGDRFSVDFFTRQCTDIFGDHITSSSIDRSVYNSNVAYGALDTKATNVIYVHGTVDPWHTLGLTESNDVNVRTILIQGTAHCANMYEPREEDLPQLKAAHEKTLQKLEPLAIFGFDGKMPGGIKVHPGGKHIIFAIGNKISVMNIQTDGQEFLSGHTNTISAFDVAPTGQLLASGQKLEPLAIFGFDGKMPGGIKVHPGGKHIIFAIGNKISVMNIQTDGQEFLSGHTNTISAFDVAPTGQLLASGQFTCARYLPSGIQILATGSDRRITYWEVFDASLVRDVEGSLRGSINSLSFAGTGDFFASAGSDQLLRFWDYNLGLPVGLGRGHSAEILVVTCSPVGVSL